MHADIESLSPMQHTSLFSASCSFLSLSLQSAPPPSAHPLLTMRENATLVSPRSVAHEKSPHLNRGINFKSRCLINNQRQETKHVFHTLRAHSNIHILIKRSSRTQKQTWRHPGIYGELDSSAQMLKITNRTDAPPSY